MHSMHVLAIPAFRDNYFWLLHDQHNAVIVDPGDAGPVLKCIADLNLQLTAILITHHHYDHVGGISDLLAVYPDIPVYGPATETIIGVTQRVADNDCIQLDALALSLQVLALPGHTLGHIAYYANTTAEPLLFCGDTLFAAGCGRLFDGTATQMVNSLRSLTTLPGNTKIYCAHEYTLGNIQFAKHLEPNNSELLNREIKVTQQRAQQQPTLPTVLSLEFATNPFLRLQQPAIQAAAANYAGHAMNNATEVFASLRHWKDFF